MTVGVYLYLWVALAGSNASYSYDKRFAFGWVESGVYQSEKACESAIVKLGLTDKSARCVPQQ